MMFNVLIFVMFFIVFKCRDSFAYVSRGLVKSYASRVAFVLMFCM